MDLTVPCIRRLITCVCLHGIRFSKSKAKREVLSPSCGLSLHAVRRLVLFLILKFVEKETPMLRRGCFNVSQHKTSSNFEKFFVFVSFGFHSVSFVRSR
jgi:hypothetical protein